MKLRQLILPTFFLAVLFGCSEPENKHMEHMPATADPNNNSSAHLIVDFQNPVFIDSSDHVMYPLAAKTDDAGSDYSIFSKRTRESRTYWNIAFYDLVTKEHHLLDAKRKMLIYSFSARDASGGNYDGDITAGKGDNKLIFYLITIDDLNINGELDNDDPSYLFTTDRNGNFLKQISPDKLNVVSWRMNAKRNKILIQTVEDSNHDKKFDEKDEVIPYVYDLGSGKTAEPVFDKEFIGSTKKLLEKQWPVKN